MKIYIASDHRGVNLKNTLIDYLNIKYEIREIGLENFDTDDYPDFAFKLGNIVNKDNDNLGILICGNGIGMSIAANKVKGIRCARVLSEEDAFNARSHNGANVIAIGADLNVEKIKKIIDVFINTKVVSEDRHLNRVKKIINYEDGTYNEL